MIDVGQGTSRAKRLLQKKMVFVIIVIIVASLAVGLAWKTFYPSDKEAIPEFVAVPISDIQLAAAHYTQNGDVQGGLAYFDSQIQQRENVDEKQLLLIYKSNFASDAKRYDVALDAAKQADALKSDASTAVALARVYELSGDKRQALTYYKKALDKSDKSTQNSRSQGMLEYKITELES
jgi:tetratricopeptide (TPR) repeat protein